MNYNKELDAYEMSLAEYEQKKEELRNKKIVLNVGYAEYLEYLEKKYLQSKIFQKLYRERNEELNFFISIIGKGRSGKSAFSIQLALLFQKPMDWKQYLDRYLIFNLNTFINVIKEDIEATRKGNVFILEEIETYFRKYSNAEAERKQNHLMNLLELTPYLDNIYIMNSVSFNAINHLKKHLDYVFISHHRGVFLAYKKVYNINMMTPKWKLNREEVFYAMPLTKEIYEYYRERELKEKKDLAKAELEKLKDKNLENEIDFNKLLEETNWIFEAARKRKQEEQEKENFWNL